MMSTRPISIFVLILIIAALLLACNEPKEEGRFYNDDLEFSIRFPDGWSTMWDPESESWCAFSPLENDADMFYEAIGVASFEMPLRFEVEELFEEIVKATTQESSGFREKDRGEAYIDDHTALWITYTYRMPEGQVQAKTYVLTDGYRAYIITCDAEPHKFSDYQAILEHSAESFRVG